MSKKKQLFLSFRSLLEMLVRQEVSTQDLSTCLFAFHSTRSYVLIDFGAPSHRLSQIERDYATNYSKAEREKRFTIWRNLAQPAVHAASQDGRITWKAEDIPTLPYGQLATFLHLWGYTTVPTVLPNTYSPYIYPFDQEFKSWLEQMTSGNPVPLEVVIAQ